MKATISMLLALGISGLSISIQARAENIIYDVTFADGSKGNLTQKTSKGDSGDQADYTKTRYHFMNTQEGPDVQADHIYILDDPKDAAKKKVVMVREKQQMGRNSTLGSREETPQTKVTEKADRTVSTAYCKLNPGDSCQVSMKDDNPDMGKPYATIKRTK